MSASDLTLGQAWSHALDELQDQLDADLKTRTVRRTIAWAAECCNEYGVTPLQLHADIAEQAYLNRKSVQTSLRRLRQHGWLHTEVHERGAGLSYRLTLPAWAANQMTKKLAHRGNTNDSEYQAAI